MKMLIEKCYSRDARAQFALNMSLENCVRPQIRNDRLDLSRTHKNKVGPYRRLSKGMISVARVTCVR